ATLGEGANIGAGTIFVNYDGVDKHHTTVGDHAFVGCDSLLVAPVHVDDGAYTAAGSVITDEVPPGAIGVARGRQRNIEGWVERTRAGTRPAEAARRARSGEATSESERPADRREAVRGASEKPSATEEPSGEATSESERPADRREAVRGATEKPSATEEPSA